VTAPLDPAALAPYDRHTLASQMAHLLDEMSS
jgi:hypothetical protein